MPNWNPISHPFVVRSYRQSSLKGHYGWDVRNVGSPFASYEEARSLADKPMGRGETSRVVCQAMNPDNWVSAGRWKTRFERKRGGNIKETSE